MPQYLHMVQDGTNGTNPEVTGDRDPYFQRSSNFIVSPDV